jgi:hypothetical protein
LVVLRPGHTAYAFGVLNTSLDRAFPEVAAAVESACAELGWSESHRKQSLVDIVFERRTDLNRNVVVRVEQTGRTSSRVRIRVSHGGDETVSRRLLDRIRTHLPPPSISTLAAR